MQSAVYQTSYVSILTFNPLISQQMASSFHTLSHSTTKTTPIRFSQINQSPLKNPLISFPLKSSNFPLRFPAISISLSSLNFTPKSTLMAKSEKGYSNVDILDSEEQVAFELAKFTANLSDYFVNERGAFTVVVSGGSLIKSLRKLAEPPYSDSIDWTKWHVFWVDERVVPKDHPDSNYKLAYDGFLSKVPIPPGNVYAINDSLSTEGAADDYETGLKQLVKTNILATSPTSGFPKFDVMLLGMGPDGHVASLFPGHPLLKESQRWVTSINDSPKPPPERITFTFPVINSSANIALVVCGSGKAAVVKTALSGDQSSDMLPIQMVSPEGDLKWFLDKDAAAML